jgi:2-polyprenyl-3-methyl-5-hydroxy-6-metoxy-1,4-benzoquinol methylase
MQHILDRACPLCGTPSARAARTDYGSAEWPILNCRQCGLAFVGRTPLQSEFEDERAWEKSFVRETEQRAREHGALFAIDRLTRARFKLAYRRRPKAIVARLARPGPVLDLGCGDGNSFNPPPAGYIPFGIDVSKGLAATADAAFRSFGGKCIWAPAAEGLAAFQPKYFTAAIMLGYLEHEFHPLEILRHVRQLLTDDAIVIVKMPNYASINRQLTGRKWCGFRLPDHVNYYTPRTLVALATRAGFNISFGLLGRQPFSDNMWAVLRPTHDASESSTEIGTTAKKLHSALESLPVH